MSHLYPCCFALSSFLHYTHRKTLQTITTILDNRSLLQHSKPGVKHPPSLPPEELEARKRESELWDNSVVEWKHEMEMNNVPKKMWPKKVQAARAGTLVICPVIALSQWKSELEKFVEPETFSIATYHGPNRAKEFPLQKLIKYDIVLTTYQVLEQDFRKMVSPNKVTCPNCGGKFKVRMSGLKFVTLGTNISPEPSPELAVTFELL